MGKLVLYHNTSNENAIKINKEGIIPGLRKDIYGKGSEAEGSGIWCSTIRSYGYGGATITFEIDENDEALGNQNDTEYIVYRKIKPEEIIDIDLMISDIPCNRNRKDNINSTVESDIPSALEYWGKDDILKVFGKNASHFAKPYNLEQLTHLIETGEKYCKGKMTLIESYVLKGLEDGKSFDIAFDTNRSHLEKFKEELRTKPSNIIMWIEENDTTKRTTLTEAKHKIEEVSRNELLAKTKKQTITRYNKAAGYKGFTLADIDTTSILTTNCLRATCKVGDYWDTVEMQNILYWIQIEAEKNPDRQINTKGITAAIMNSIDGMDIKVDCTCRRLAISYGISSNKVWL